MILILYTMNTKDEKSEKEPYERLPEEMRAEMTKKQYENTSMRGGEEEGDSLLPVVIFSFSKKKCEEIADFLKSQDLLSAKEKGEVIFIIYIYIYIYLGLFMNKHVYE
jgi:superfamily II RNA helicase